MLKKHPADPTSIKGLVLGGLFFLAAGLGLGYYIQMTTEVPTDPSAAHVVMMIGAVAAGLCWIGAAAKRVGK